MKKISELLKITFFAVFTLAVATTVSSCSDDDDEEKENINDDGNQGGEDEDEMQSIYQPEMFFGVWKLTETVVGSYVDVEDDPNSEWQMVFYTDRWDGCKGEGQKRLFTNGGFRYTTDFEWWLGYNDEIHIMEYDSGSESVREVLFEDRGNTMLIYGYNGPSSFERYVKVN